MTSEVSGAPALSRREARLRREQADAAPHDVARAHAELPDEAVATEVPAAPENISALPEAAADEFEAAARLFSFTGESAVVAPPAPDIAAAVESSAASSAPGHVGRRRGRAVLKRAATASFSLGVVAVVGILAVGMTTPASVVAATSDAAAALKSSSASVSGVVTPEGKVEVDPDDIQVYVAPSDIQAVELDRNEGYTTASMAELASDYAIARPSDFYINDVNAAIQWPFAVGVAITWGFVMRDGRMHNGADFVPGEGAHVQAIADGTVRIATESGGGFGVTVLIDHIIDGELVSSRYAHMQRGSLQVQVGDTVKVGQYIGNTGNTGRSFGAHTHFEILANGTTPIDPIVWLRANAGRDSLG